MLRAVWGHMLRAVWGHMLRAVWGHMLRAVCYAWFVEIDMHSRNLFRAPHRTGSEQTSDAAKRGAQSSEYHQKLLHTFRHLRFGPAI